MVGNEPTIGKVEDEELKSLQELEAQDSEARLMACIDQACDRLSQRLDDCVRRAKAA